MPEFPIQQIFNKSGESLRSVFSYARTDGEKRRDQVRGEVGERIQGEKTREWHCGAEG